MTSINTQRDAETAVALIYLDWATRSAQKAYDTDDPLARMFYRENAIRDFNAAIAYLSHKHPRD